MSEIINNCRTLTMDKFIDCLVNGNMKCLVVSGEPTDEEIQSAWEQIWDEYCILLNQPNYKIILKTLQNIVLYESKLIAIDYCMIVLSRQHSEPCIEILKKFGFNYSFDFNDKEQFEKDLKNVKSISKVTLIKLKGERKNYEIQIKKSESKAIKESDFDKTFISLSKFMGYKVNATDTTVSEYCSMISMINKDSGYGRR